MGEAFRDCIPTGREMSIRRVDDDRRLSGLNPRRPRDELTESRRRSPPFGTESPQAVR